jgi:site-specific recombinase XerD
MTKRNGPNERIKREYLQILREAKGRDEASLDAVAKAIDRFEEHSKNRAFKRFHVEQARAFKAHLIVTRNARTGEPLSASTVHSTLAALRAFFIWLSQRRSLPSEGAARDKQREEARSEFVRLLKWRCCPGALLLIGGLVFLYLASAQLI